MRRIRVCQHCPDRVRVVTEDGITDCHTYCKKYLDACEKETERIQTARKKSSADYDLLNYHITDIQKHRRKK